MSWLGYSCARASPPAPSIAASASVPAASSSLGLFLVTSILRSPRRFGLPRCRPGETQLLLHAGGGSSAIRPNLRRLFRQASAQGLDLGHADVLAPFLDGLQEHLLGLVRRVDVRVAAELVEERLGLVRRHHLHEPLVYLVDHRPWRAGWHDRR